MGISAGVLAARRHAGWLALLLFLTGCSHWQVMPAWLASLEGHPHRLPVPMVWQAAPNHCGIAAVDMVSAYYSQPLPEAVRADLVARCGPCGVRVHDLADALAGAGFRTELFSGTFDHGANGILRALDEGDPLVALVRFPGGRNHYVVITGYDESRARIYLNDPADGRRAMRSAYFLRGLEEAGGYLLRAKVAGHD